MKTTHLIITAVVISVLMFIFDGVYHGFLMKSFYDKYTASFYYPEGQQKMIYLFFSEFTLFGILTFFVSRTLKSNSIISGMFLGGLFCLAMGGTFVLVNHALMPGWGKTISVVEASWNIFQGVVSGAIVVVFTNFFAKRS